MIPKVNNILEKGFEIVEQPSKTYGLKVEKNIISGYVDSLEAIKQAIFLILNTERYKYEIYSWNYGVELADLYGEPKEYVYPELKRRITEALTQDDRILEVDAFSFTSNKSEITATFIIHTTMGDIPGEKVVKI